MPWGGGELNANKRPKFFLANRPNGYSIKSYTPTDGQSQSKVCVLWKNESIDTNHHACKMWMLDKELFNLEVHYQDVVVNNSSGILYESKRHDNHTMILYIYTKSLLKEKTKTALIYNKRQMF